MDSSRQVGDQFLISGSPQIIFGRIGEWATSNLQPWLSRSQSMKPIHHAFIYIVMIVWILSRNDIIYEYLTLGNNWQWWRMY